MLRCPVRASTTERRETGRYGRLTGQQEAVTHVMFVGTSSEPSLEAYLQCLVGNVGTAYYSNSGALGGGNITWTE